MYMYVHVYCVCMCMCVCVRVLVYGRSGGVCDHVMTKLAAFPGNMGLCLLANTFSSVK